MARGNNPSHPPLARRGGSTSAAPAGTSRLSASLLTAHRDKRRQEALKQLSKAEAGLTEIDAESSLSQRLHDVRGLLRRIACAHVAGPPEDEVIPGWIEGAVETLDPAAIPEDDNGRHGYYYYGSYTSQLRGGQEAEAAWLREVLPTLADAQTRAEFLEREGISIRVEDERLQEDARNAVRDALDAGEYADARATALAYQRAVGADRLANLIEVSPLEDWERQARRLRADRHLLARLSEISDKEDNPYRYRYRPWENYSYLLTAPPSAADIDAMIAPPPTGAAADAQDLHSYGVRTGAHYRRPLDTHEQVSRFVRSLVRKREAAGVFAAQPPVVAVSTDALAEVIDQVSTRPGAGGIAITAAVHPSRRGQRLFRLHTRLVVTAADGTEVPVIIESELGTTAAKTDAGVEKAARRLLGAHAALAEGIEVEPLASTKSRPSRWSVDQPVAAPIEHILGQERCKHTRGRWAAARGPHGIETGIGLNCDECQRTSIAYVPLHQIPEGQWAQHTKVDKPEYEAYLRWRAELAGDPVRSLSEVQRDDPARPSLNPEDYAVGPVRATTGNGPRTTLRGALAGRR